LVGYTEGTGVGAPCNHVGTPVGIRLGTGVGENSLYVGRIVGLGVGACDGLVG